ncbi:WG repeat-containing protein [Bacteroides faecium]|uniref:WG repeat-containing protein n=1 Tax=Bacteroides faecium TaxID=2715212 RepID=A0A6H0KRE7_9BACE|nr:WG repeat-containing protein [Bacteroides faecium]QIU95088.1 WG repeat-containing protein [Bacteroides faecium]
MKKSILIGLIAFITLGSSGTLFAQDLTLQRDKKGRVGLVDAKGKFVVKPKYDEIGNFEGGLAKVRIKDKFGFINEKGDVVLKVQYSVIEDFVDGVAKICIGAKYNKNTDDLEGGKWGYVEDNGEILIKPIYDDIEYFNKFNIAKTKKGKVYGWVSRYGQELIKPEYTEIGELIDGMARVCKGGKIGKSGQLENGKWGFVDDGGRIVIKVKYRSAGEFCEGVAWVGTGPMRYSYINKQGMVISEDSYTNNNARNGIIIQQKMLHKKESKTGKKGMFYGILDTRGMVLEDFVYNAIAMNQHNWASALDISTGKSYFLHNENGKITKLEAGALDFKFNNEIERYTIGDKSGYVRRDGKLMIEPKYKVLGDYTDYTIASENGSGFGYLSKTGDVLIPFEYDKTSAFNDGYASVCKQNKWYVIDSKNNVTLTTDMDYLGVYSEGLIPAMKGGKAGFISLDGKEAMPFNYEMVSSVHKGKFNYKENGKWGIKDAKGTVLLAPAYEDLSNFYDEFGNKILANAGKFGLLNFEEKEILSPTFDFLGLDSQHGIYIVSQKVTKDNCKKAADIMKEYIMGESQKGLLDSNLYANLGIDMDKVKGKVMKKMEKGGTFAPEKFIGESLWGAVSKDGQVIIEAYCPVSPLSAYQVVIGQYGQKKVSADDIEYLMKHPGYYIVNYNRFKVSEVIPEELWDF